MNLTPVRHLACALILGALLIAGCSSAGHGSSPKPDANFDVCAMRLHEISGALLLYYSTNYHLPADLNELHRLPGFEHLEFTCPTSGKPYTYSAQGIAIPGQDAKVVLYDSTPAHPGFRWSIQMTAGVAGQPPFSTIVPLTEDHFSDGGTPRP